MILINALSFQFCVQGIKSKLYSFRIIFRYEFLIPEIKCAPFELLVNNKSNIPDINVRFHFMMIHTVQNYKLKNMGTDLTLKSTERRQTYFCSTIK